MKEANEQLKVTADKYRYSKELFDPPNSAAPTFGVDEAYQSVGGEAPDGKVHLDGHPMTRFTVGVNKIAGARGAVPVQ